ncbi:Putative ScnA-like protein (modular protein) [Stutzerimonas xanthomarina]|nr:Putative ScnA-like protein (modular protein) [Stutzerimonas xanthomarina]
MLEESIPMTKANRIPARFQKGDRVQVLDLGLEGHIRTPAYIRGKSGEVIQLCGFFLNPEDLSVGDTGGPVYPLYRVRFAMNDLWPDYERGEGDELCIEIYDHWLAAPPDQTPATEKHT